MSTGAGTTGAGTIGAVTTGAGAAAAMASLVLGMMGLERSPVGCGVATAFLWLWRAASSFGTGNPYGVLGVRLLFVGAKVSSGGGFTSEVRRGLVCRRDDGT